MEFHNKAKMARVLLNWNQQKLADNSGMSKQGIARIELKMTSPSVSSQQKIIKAFEVENVFFTEHGVEQREESIRTVKDFQAVLMDVQAVLNKGDEILHHCASEKRNSGETTQIFASMIKKGIKMRFTICEGDTTTTTNINNYRQIDKNYFNTAQVTLIYADRYVVHIKKSSGDVFLIIKDVEFADIQRAQFEYWWSYGEKINA